jgi:hypothetical protein
MAFVTDAPGVSFEEIVSYPSSVPLLNTSVPVFFGVAEWGPLFTPTKLSNGFAAYQALFGDHLSYSDLPYCVDNFHKEAAAVNAAVGGEVYVSRLAKLNAALSDVADSVVRASTTLDGVTTDPTGATLLGTASPGLYLGGWAVPRNTEVLLKWTVDSDGVSGAEPPATFECTIIGYAAEIESEVVVGDFAPDTPGTSCFLELRVAEGQNPLPIYFSAVSYTALQLIDAINSQIYKCVAELTDDNKVKFTHDSGGTSSYLAITNGSTDILTYLGWSISSLPEAVPSGVSNVADTLNVTIDEIKDIIEAVDGVTVTVSITVSPMKFNMTTVATGATVTLTFDSTDDTALARQLFGIPVTTFYGSDAGTASPSLKVWAKYYGLKGNRISVKTLKNSKRATRITVEDPTQTDLTDAGVVAGRTYFDVPSLYGYEADMVLRITSEDESQIEWVVIDRLETITVGDDSTYRLHVTSDNTISGVLEYTFAQSGTKVESMEFDLYVYLDAVLKETFGQLSINDTADTYFSTIIDDEFGGSKLVEVEPATGAAEHLNTLFPEDLTQAVWLTGATLETEDDYSISNSNFVGSLTYQTGMYAIHKLRFAASLVAYPNANAYCQKKLHLYMNQRKDLFYVASVPTSDTGFTTITGATAAFNWRDRNGFDTMYASLYFPHGQVDDPIGRGTTPQKSIDLVGNILGLYARVDNMSPPDGGVWAADAGEGDYGTLYYVNELDYEIDEDTELGMLNKAGINCILQRQGRIEVWGARTLSSDVKWRYIPVRRLFIALEQSVLQGTRFAVFRGNNPRWWNILKEAVERLLDNVWRDGGLVGETAEEAYYVKMGLADGTMTQADINEGREIGEFGGAPVKPAEFIVWRVNQLAGGEVVVA